MLRRPLPMGACLGLALLALPPLVARTNGAAGQGAAATSATQAVAVAPAPATREAVLPPQIVRIRRGARQQVVDLRLELLAFERQVRDREAVDSWNGWLHYKLADTLGQLWSAGRDLERSLAEAPLDIERQLAAVRNWQPALARLRDLNHRLRQRDTEGQARPSAAAPLVVLPPGMGSLSGRVTDTLSGLGVDGWVELYDAAGSWIALVDTDTAGGYAFAPLAPGGYHVRTSSLRVGASRRAVRRHSVPSIL